VSRALRAWRGTARSAAPYALLVPALAFLVFLLMAAVFLLRYSVNLWSPTTGMISAWSIHSYVTFLSHPYFVGALVKSMRLAFLVTVIALAIGYPVAYLMSVSPRYRNLITILVVAPLIMDVVIRAYGWIVLLSNGGLVNVAIRALGLTHEPVKLLYTEWAVVAELLHETLAFMVLPIAAVLQKIDPSLREAGGTLGATRWRTFCLITFPLSLPGVLAGTFLVFALGMSAFVGPLILGGGNVTVMSLVIRDQIGVTLDWPLGSAMSIVLVTLTLVLLFLYGRLMQAGIGRNAMAVQTRR
jgi:ABC-type spermidine/putrescine transport system permease subunit I